MNHLTLSDSGRIELSDERNLPTWRDEKPCYADCGNEWICSETKLCKECQNKANLEDMELGYEPVTIPLTL